MFIFPLTTLGLRLLGRTDPCLDRQPAPRAECAPFGFLYGMRLFGLLAFGLVALGLTMSQRSAGGWADPAWITGAVLLLFSAAGAMVTRWER